MKKHYLYIALLLSSLTGTVQANVELPELKEEKDISRGITPPPAISQEDYNRLMQSEEPEELDPRWFSSTKFLYKSQKATLLDPLKLEETRLYKQTWPLTGKQEWYQTCTYEINQVYPNPDSGEDLYHKGTFTIEAVFPIST